MGGLHSRARFCAQHERERFLSLLTHDDRNSYYILSTCANGTWREAAYKKSQLENVPLDGAASCYVTHNGFTSTQRKATDVRQLNALFFDLDCHTVCAQEARAAIDAACKLLAAACSSHDLPEPTLIVDSGRGVHLYYVLDRSIPYRIFSKGPVNEKGIGLFRRVQQQLARLIEEIVSPVQGIEVDRKVFDFTRVARIPGTFNEAAGCYARLVSENEAFHDLSNLALWKPKGALSAPPEKRASASRWRRPAPGSAQPLLASRLAKIAELQELRGFSCEGNRELMGFVFYNTAVQVFSREEAERKLARFNARFTTPLPASELRGIKASVDRVVNVRGQRGFYLLGARKLIELLGMTPEESQTIGFFASKRLADRSAAKQRTRQKRAQRNDAIVALYRSGRYTQADVARKCGCSERTVASVLKEAGETRRIRSTSVVHIPWWKAKSVKSRKEGRKIVDLLQVPMFIRPVTVTCHRRKGAPKSFANLRATQTAYNNCFETSANICHTSLRVVRHSCFLELLCILRT